MSKREFTPAPAPTSEQPPSDDLELAIFSAEIGVCPQLDLHGFRSDIEGEIDRFLYRENQKGTDVVKIIHGKGTQQLRKQTEKFLAHHPLVGRARLSHNPTEANAVTYVALAHKT